MLSISLTLTLCDLSDADSIPNVKAPTVPNVVPAWGATDRERKYAGSTSGAGETEIDVGDPSTGVILPQPFWL